MRRVVLAVWNYFEERTGTWGEIMGPMMLHPVPKKSAWFYVFGSATLFAFLIQVATGVALGMAYVPSAGEAYASLEYITHEAFLGHFLRGMHYFGASAMVLLIGLHTIRVYLFGSYKYPREVSWLTGVALLGLTLAMGFTGQLLRWDQTGVWSVVVAAEQAARAPFVGPLVAKFIMAGNTVGGATLSRFFAIHVFLLPALIFAFIGLHVWMVVRNGISEPPVAGQPVDPKTYRQWYHDMVHRVGVPFFPDAAWRDAVFGVFVLVVCAVLAITVGPPELVAPPDPSDLNANPRPDWYLLWYFAVLAMLPHGTEKFVIVFAPLAFFTIMCLLPFLSNKGERHPLRRPWSIAIVLATILIIATFWIAGLRSPWAPDFEAKPLPPELVGTTEGPVARGAVLFHKKGCEYCHDIGGYGGHRGPELTTVGDRLDEKLLTLRIINGGYNMPAYANNITHEELTDLVAFLASRKTPTGAEPTERQ